MTLKIDLSRWFFVSALSALFALSVDAQEQTNSLRWQNDIREFEASDATNPPPRDAILFVGSSSIRFWKTLSEDFPDQKVINRGFGGSQIEDVNYFTDRIVLPYRPGLILLYAGDNDLAAGKSPQQVLADFKEFVNRVHQNLPETHIMFLSIKPSPARRNLLESMREANKLVRDFTKTQDRLEFIDLFTHMLNDQGEPRGELFVQDKLHMNRQGYELWTRLIKPHLSVVAPRR